MLERIRQELNLIQLSLKYKTNLEVSSYLLVFAIERIIKYHIDLLGGVPEKDNQITRLIKQLRIEGGAVPEEIYTHKEILNRWMIDARYDPTFQADKELLSELYQVTYNYYHYLKER